MIFKYTRVCCYHRARLDGTYIASVPELPGCHTQGSTLEELYENVKEAIELYLEVEAEKGKMR